MGTKTFCLSFENGYELIRSDVACVLGSLFFCQFTLGRFFRQLFDARSEIGVGLVLKQGIHLLRQDDLQYRSNGLVERRGFRKGVHNSSVT